ncbi:hypothetical protein NQ315_007913, partial [Exocentrus adspersus]
ALSVKCDVQKDDLSILNFTVKGVEDPELIIKSYGYPAETHKITTEDGYILVLHRIPRGIKGVKKKTPILIMHGLGSSSGDFINMGPDNSLGYILADNGYDVWIGNARGNSYSNSHLYINPNLNPEKFYNFSWHEIGTIDIPAKIDYILKVTNQSKLYYIGHSQGGTIFFVMTSVKPQYNDKIRLASLMAPAGFVSNVPDPVIKLMSGYIDEIEYILEFFQIYHIPYLDVIRSFLQNICKYDNYYALCKEIFNIFGGGYNDEAQFNKSIFTKLFATTPSDASRKQFVHYFQEVKSGKFQRFDYGPGKNLRTYGALNPLKYNLTAVTAPVALYYARNDRYIGVKDVEKIASKLSHVVNNYLVPHEKFNHGGFLFASDIRPLVYNELMRVMKFY